MSKSKNKSRLFELLGITDNEIIPANLKEAVELAGGVQRDNRPTCPKTGKHAFPSESQAKRAMRARLNKGANTSKMRVYICEFCKNWHLTSKMSGK